MKKWQQKWGVSPMRLLLILLTFALGGSLTGWVGKKLMASIGVKPLLLYIPVYLLLITFLWPVMVLLVSIPFGQFSFFKSYLARLAASLTNKTKHADRS